MTVISYNKYGTKCEHQLVMGWLNLKHPQTNQYIEPNFILVIILYECWANFFFCNFQTLGAVHVRL